MNKKSNIHKNTRMSDVAPLTLIEISNDADQHFISHYRAISKFVQLAKDAKIVGVIGAAGSGKSTFCNMLIKMLYSNAGVHPNDDIIFPISRNAKPGTKGINFYPRLMPIPRSNIILLDCEGQGNYSDRAFDSKVQILILKVYAICDVVIFLTGPRPSECSVYNIVHEMIDKRNSEKLCTKDVHTIVLAKDASVTDEDEDLKSFFPSCKTDRTKLSYINLNSPPETEKDRFSKYVDQLRRLREYSYLDSVHKVVQVISRAIKLPKTSQEDYLSSNLAAIPMIGDGVIDLSAAEKAEFDNLSAVMKKVQMVMDKNVSETSKLSRLFWNSMNAYEACKQAYIIAKGEFRKFGKFVISNRIVFDLAKKYYNELLYDYQNGYFRIGVGLFIVGFVITTVATAGLGLAVNGIAKATQLVKIGAASVKLAKGTKIAAVVVKAAGFVASTVATALGASSTNGKEEEKKGHEDGATEQDIGQFLLIRPVDGGEKELHESFLFFFGLKSELSGEREVISCMPNNLP